LLEKTIKEDLCTQFGAHITNFSYVTQVVVVKRAFYNLDKAAVVSITNDLLVINSGLGCATKRQIKFCIEDPDFDPANLVEDVIEILRIVLNGH
jgi:hypothetical protein